METETIDRLYLELSQFTQAKTAKEIALESRLATYEDALRTISLGKSDGLDHAEDVARLERAVNIARKALEDNK